MPRGDTNGPRALASVLGMREDDECGWWGTQRSLFCADIINNLSTGIPGLYLPQKPHPPIEGSKKDCHTDTDALCGAGSRALGTAAASYSDLRACWKPAGEGAVRVIWRGAARVTGVMESIPVTLSSQDVWVILKDCLEKRKDAGR